MARFIYHTCYSIQNSTDWQCPEALFCFFPKEKKKEYVLMFKWSHPKYIL